MDRPVSIKRFEQFYLGSWVVGLIGLAINWNAQVELLHNTPAAVQMGDGMVYGSLIGGTLVSAIVTLLLWYFAARRASVVAKWIATVLCVLSVLAMLLGLLRHNPDVTLLTTVFGILVRVLEVIAIVYLFRPDAKAWFGETGTTGPVA